MKRSYLGPVAALVLIAGSGAALSQTVVITPENETVIREYVVRQQVAPVTLPSDIEIVEGTALPETVEVYELDVPDMETRYSYVVVDGRTVVVEPETRRIIRVMD